MATTVVGLFDDREHAQSAVRDLTEAGFRRQDISIVAADPGGSMYKQHVDDEGNIAGEGAATGLTSGAVVGGLLGLLIGVGLIFVPAGVLAAGPITGLIAGGAAGAAVGGVIGGLVGLGIPKEDADLYAEGVRRGGTLVMVSTDDSKADRAHQILDRDGAVDIEDRGEWYRSHGFSEHDPNAPVYSTEESLAERERWRAAAAGTTNEASASPMERSGSMDVGLTEEERRARVRRYPTSYGAYADQPSGTEPDTRGVGEKISDAVTGDRIDDKTGRRVD